VRSGHGDEARRLVAVVESLVALTPSPWFQSALRYARALLAVDREAEDRFTEALAWDKTMPFMRARLHLALGEWLRRRRRVADSRAPLRAARDAFDVLRADAWSNRAREELRASGESRKRRTWETLDWLTPQEMQIVQLAAQGLSNREIGRRLYLSHRTVESHLYRVFPKLGVSSRSQLTDALDTASDPMQVSGAQRSRS
jgi:DNA-binding CsgD family transcriptional regulator